MAEVMEWYAADRDTRTFSCACGWKGHLSGMGKELFGELVEHDCPECYTSLVIRQFPTHAEVRKAAKRGDPEAMRALAETKKAESRAKRAKASELKNADQLPELGLAEATTFVWDVEERDDESWAVVRLAGSGTEVWRELAYWEGWERGIAVRDLLAERYGPMFAGLVATWQGRNYLAGDTFRSPLEPADEQDAPWVGS